MLQNALEASDSTDVASIRTAYDARLSATLESVGIGTASAETGIDPARLEAVLDEEASDLTLEEAASVLALEPDAPEADAIAYEARDHVLMGMTNAVLDVDTLASLVDTDLTGQEIQQAIEGRTRLTLDELAEIQHAIATRRSDS